jgi:pimeloyl-ACP methyl ester carboxylesterase
MGDVSGTPAFSPEAVEHRLSWGPVLRGQRLGAGHDAALLVHEPGSDLDAWALLSPRLAGVLPLQIVAFDLPGHGLSDDPWQPDRLDAALREIVQAMPAIRFVVAAGSSALAALRLAADLALAGLVCLSPDPLQPGSSLERSPRVPKHVFAGSAAGNDLQTARRLASSSGGWAAVTSLPVSERGTGLLTTDWAGRVVEEIAAFLRDCQTRRPLAGGDVRLPPRVQYR